MCSSMADVLGSVAFTPVKSDILGNIKVGLIVTFLLIDELTGGKKVRDRQLAAPADSESLQSLVVNELKTKKHTAAEGLLWLVRLADNFRILHCRFADLAHIVDSISPPRRSDTIFLMHRVSCPSHLGLRIPIPLNLTTLSSSNLYSVLLCRQHHIRKTSTRSWRKTQRKVKRR